MLLDTLDPAVLLAVFAIMFAAGAIQGAVGYGMAMVSAPLLILIDARTIPAPMMMTALVFSILVLLRERHSADLFGLKWAIAGRIPGAIIGGMLLSIISPGGFKIVFACLILLAVGMSISGLRFPPKRRVRFTAGLISGIMATIASIGGPPIALIYQDSAGDEFRATLGGYFIVGVIISLTTLASIGRVGLVELKLCLVLLPGTIAGFLLSSRLTSFLDRGYTRPAILTVAALSAVVALGQQLFA